MLANRITTSIGMESVHYSAHCRRLLAQLGLMRTRLRNPGGMLWWVEKWGAQGAGGCGRSHQKTKGISHLRRKWTEENQETKGEREWKSGG